MSVILDAGALVAIERGDLELVSILRRERAAERLARTHGGVIGQVWRGGAGRQSILARLLAGIEVVPLDEDLGKRVGVLLARSHTSDVVDAAVVLIANDGDEIFTADPRDLTRLAEAAGRTIDLIAI